MNVWSTTGLEGQLHNLAYDLLAHFIKMTQVNSQTMIVQ